MKPKALFPFVFVFVFLFALWGRTTPAMAVSGCDRGIEVALNPADPTETFTVHLSCWSSGNSQGKTILFLHGLSHNGSIYYPLVNTIFSTYGDQVYEILALDLPGHGESEMPVNLTFGLLSLADYVSVIEQVLAQESIDILAAHSMGTLETNMLQDQLVAQGSTLKLAYGVKGVLLLAPVIPETPDPQTTLEWEYTADKAELLAELFIHLRYTPALGMYMAFPPYSFLTLFFADEEEGIGVVAGAPSTSQVAGLNEYEPYLAASEMTGMDSDLHRPVIQPGIFAAANSPLLYTVAFQYDTFMKTSEIEALHQYLLDDPAANNFYTVTGSRAVHDGFYAEPNNQILLGAIGSLLNSIP